MTIRYHTFWVRAICCLAVAIGVANIVYFGHLVALDLFLRDIFVYSQAHRFEAVPRSTEFIIIFAVCLLPALPRIERPFTMVVSGGLLLIAYTFAVFVTQLGFGWILPLASPLLGLLGSSTLLGTMAWSEERSLRRDLEGLENARQQFTDMLVHDLRRHMSSILMSLTVLSKQTTADDRSTVAIRASGERMLVLINNLLDVRKMEEGKLLLQRECLPLSGLISDCLDEHRPAAELMNVKLHITNEDDGDVRVDREVFSRILTNLLWNAFQHAPSGSSIEVGYGHKAGTPSFYVANHAAPIPPSELGQMFSPFVSGRDAPSGNHVSTTGLGLAFCKLAVEAHGGTIALQSPWPPHDDGVKVVVTLPA